MAVWSLILSDIIILILKKMDFGWLSLTDSSVENIHSRHQEESVNTTTKKLQKPIFPI